MSNPTKLTDPSVPTLSAIGENDIIAIFNAESGNVSRIKYTQFKKLISDVVASSGTVMRKVILPNGNLDFNDLTEDMTIYSFASDVPKGTVFTNAPVTPSGGFSLICLKEGVYRRQIYRVYGSTKTYTRTETYQAAGRVWNNWYIVNSEIFGGGVNDYPLISYVLAKKGGRHEYSNTNLQRFDKRNGYGCDGLPRNGRMFGGYKDRRVLYRGRKLYHNLSLPLFQSTWGLRGVPKGWRGIAEIYTDGLDLYMPKVLLGKREELDYVVQGDSNQGYGLARKEVAYV